MKNGKICTHTYDGNFNAFSWWHMNNVPHEKMVSVTLSHNFGSIYSELI